MAKREIICADAVEWLRKNRDVGSIVAGLPDLEETQFSANDYTEWFFEATYQCMLSASEGHPIIFCQTDRLYKGKRISKSFLMKKAAEKANKSLVYHKIVLRREPEKVNLRRPGYSHLLCFGDDNVKAGRATADVIYEGGVVYNNGFPFTAARVALEMAEKYGDRMCDPFTGMGTLPALAEYMNFSKIIGIDLDPEQCKIANRLRLEKSQFSSTKKRRRRLLENL